MTDPSEDRSGGGRRGTQPCSESTEPQEGSTPHACVAPTKFLDPRAVVADVHERFAVGPRAPKCRYSPGWGSGDEADECTRWLSDGTSWGSADSIPGHTRHDVTQHAPADRGTKQRPQTAGGRTPADRRSPGSA